MIKINIGCGKKLEKGVEWCNIDTHFENGADVVHFLPQPLTLFKDNSVDIIQINHVLEDFLPCDQKQMLVDFHRKLKVDGVLKIKMPHVSNKCFTGNLYHVKAAVSGTFNALVEGFEEDNYSEPVKFSRYLVKRVNFHREPFFLFLLYGWWNELLVNSCKPLMSLYEFTIWSNIFPAHECEWVIQK